MALKCTLLIRYTHMDQTKNMKQTVYYHVIITCFPMCAFGGCLSMTSKAITPKMYDNRWISWGSRQLFGIYIIAFYNNWTRNLVLLINSYWKEQTEDNKTPRMFFYKLSPFDVIITTIISNDINTKQLSWSPAYPSVIKQFRCECLWRHAETLTQKQTLKNT